MPLSREERKELYSVLMGYARYKTGNDHDLSQELVQHTVVKQLEQHHDNLDFVSIKYWCKRVLKNRFIDLTRKHREKQLDSEKPEDQDFADDSAVRWRVGLYGKRKGKSGFDIMPDKGSNTFMNLLYNKCMDQLKPEHREVMIECILGGKKTAELSEDIGKSQNTILTWLTKAKLQFRECIQGIA